MSCILKSIKVILFLYENIIFIEYRILIFLTEIRDFVRMLTRALDKFLLERLIFYTVPNTVS